MGQYLQHKKIPVIKAKPVIPPHAKALGLRIFFSLHTPPQDSIQIKFKPKHIYIK